MENIYEFFVWGIVALIVSLGVNVFASWLIDRAFENRKN
jgi:hypothetical protein